MASSEIMLNSGRWMYTVFMCQQAIEKIVKGLYILYIGDNVPYTHNISFLVKKMKSLLPEEVTDERFNFFDKLTAHYLDGRYPDYKRKYDERLDEQTATDYFRQTKEVYEWLLTMKP
ncbi:MAG: HEPN domain-containing protein [Deltaproteobacteria bacterium]|nr:HEPN domain-containing protein [Deltaproteobacteria bacterium]